MTKSLKNQVSDLMKSKLLLIVVLINLSVASFCLMYFDDTAWKAEEFIWTVNRTIQLFLSLGWMLGVYQLIRLVRPKSRMFFNIGLVVYVLWTMVISSFLVTVHRAICFPEESPDAEHVIYEQMGNNGPMKIDFTHSCFPEEKRSSLFHQIRVRSNGYKGDPIYWNHIILYVGTSIAILPFAVPASMILFVLYPRFVSELLIGIYQEITS